MTKLAILAALRTMYLDIKGGYMSTERGDILRAQVRALLAALETDSECKK